MNVTARLRDRSCFICIAGGAAGRNALDRRLSRSMSFPYCMRRPVRLVDVRGLAVLRVAVSLYLLADASTRTGIGFSSSTTSSGTERDDSDQSMTKLTIAALELHMATPFDQLPVLARTHGPSRSVADKEGLEERENDTSASSSWNMMHHMLTAVTTQQHWWPQSPQVPHAWVSDSMGWTIVCVFLVPVLLALMLVVGYHTRTVAALAAMCMAALHVFRPELLVEQDKVVLEILCWMVLLDPVATVAVHQAEARTTTNPEGITTLSVDAAFTALHRIITPSQQQQHSQPRKKNHVAWLCSLVVLIGIDLLFGLQLLWRHRERFSSPLSFLQRSGMMPSVADAAVYGSCGDVGTLSMTIAAALPWIALLALTPVAGALTLLYALVTSLITHCNGGCGNCRQKRESLGAASSKTKLVLRLDRACVASTQCSPSIISMIANNAGSVARADFRSSRNTAKDMRRRAAGARQRKEGAVTNGAKRRKAKKGAAAGDPQNAKKQQPPKKRDDQPPLQRQAVRSSLQPWFVAREFLALHGTFNVEACSKHDLMPPVPSAPSDYAGAVAWSFVAIHPCEDNKNGDTNERVMVCGGDIMQLSSSKYRAIIWYEMLRQSVFVSPFIWILDTVLCCYCHFAARDPPGGTHGAMPADDRDGERSKAFMFVCMQYLHYAYVILSAMMPLKLILSSVALGVFSLWALVGGAVNYMLLRRLPSIVYDARVVILLLTMTFWVHDVRGSGHGESNHGIVINSGCLLMQTCGQGPTLGEGAALDQVWWLRTAAAVVLERGLLSVPLISLFSDSRRKGDGVQSESGGTAFVAAPPVPFVNTTTTSSRDVGAYAPQVVTWWTLVGRHTVKRKNKTDLVTLFDVYPTTVLGLGRGNPHVRAPNVDPDRVRKTALAGVIQGEQAFPQRSCRMAVPDRESATSRLTRAKKEVHARVFFRESIRWQHLSQAVNAHLPLSASNASAVLEQAARLVASESDPVARDMRIRELYLPVLTPRFPPCFKKERGGGRLDAFSSPLARSFCSAMHLICQRRTEPKADSILPILAVRSLSGSSSAQVTASAAAARMYENETLRHLRRQYDLPENMTLVIGPEFSCRSVSSERAAASTA